MRLAPSAPRPLLIAGRPDEVADLALRRLLHAKKREQPLCIMDYQGVLAQSLRAGNRGNLHKTPVLWCDLAGRRKPVALFRFRRAAGMKPALTAFFARMARSFAPDVSLPVITAVVDVVWQLTEQGTMGLASILTCLRQPEMLPTLHGGRPVAPEQVERLASLVQWMLRFPSVWSLSEGNNVQSIAPVLRRGGTVWLELPVSHFECAEHEVLCAMAEAVLLEGLISTGEMKAGSPWVVHAFPIRPPLGTDATARWSRHIGLVRFGPHDPLPPSAVFWLENRADLWMVGGFGGLPVGKSTSWLTAEESHRLAGLEPGQVWVRSGGTSKAVTTLAKLPEPRDDPARAYRTHAQQGLRKSPVRQFSTAIASFARPASRHMDLYTKLCQPDSLYAGWFRVKAHNKYSHGQDGVTIEQFATVFDEEIERLRTELAERRYVLRPLRTLRIPKPDGELRIVRVACVRDRVVQAAALQLLEPIFEAQFSSSSFGYRPGRSAHQALARARSLIRSGRMWALTADIRKCFDSLDHDLLLRLVGNSVGDRDLVGLLRQWLTGDVVDFGDVFPSELGVPQGESISPLLCNIYLNEMDKEFDSSNVAFVRYADDYLLLCETEEQALAALRQMGDYLRGTLRLALKPSKTNHAHVAKGITFLGFELRGSDVFVPREKTEAVLQAVGEHIDILLGEGHSPGERWKAAIGMDSLVRGFHNYFLVDDAPGVKAQLVALDESVAQRWDSRATADPAVALWWAAREVFADPAGHLGGQPSTPNVSPYPDEVASNRSPREPPWNDTHRAAPVMLPSYGAITDDAPVDPSVVCLAGRLHVMRSGCYVGISGQELVVRRNKKEIYRAAFDSHELVYLEGRGIAVSSDLTMQLCEAGVPVVFAPSIGRPAAVAQPVHAIRSGLRQQQVLRRDDPLVVRTGLSMLAAKVGNQASVLKYFARYRKRTGDALHAELDAGAHQVRVIAGGLEQMDPSEGSVRAVAMGHEGRAAARYWSVFARLVPERLAFPGRHSHHATDPVNCALNYVYSILYGEVWRALVRAGLDPYFGIIHGTDRDQGSLVFDMIEEYRAPIGDRVVLGLLGRGFELEADVEGRLRTRCRHKLAAAFHRMWQREFRWCGGSYRAAEILEVQVASLKNVFLGKGEYRPFRFRW